MVDRLAGIARLLARVVAAAALGAIIGTLVADVRIHRDRRARCAICGTCRCNHGSDAVSAGHPFVTQRRSRPWAIRPRPIGVSDIRVAHAAAGELAWQRLRVPATE